MICFYFLDIFFEYILVNFQYNKSKLDIQYKQKSFESGHKKNSKLRQILNYFIYGSQEDIAKW